jgi:outer membrane lipoprotein carrier protein
MNKMNRINKISQFFPKLLAISVLGLSSLSLMTAAMAFNETDGKLPPSADKKRSTTTHTAVIKATAVKATDKHVLMTKLAKLNFFKANFTQQIFSESGELLQQGAGKLAISKPNLVNWQTTEPDETFIISDGETLWFYDPFIDQATAYNLAQSIHNTPILLLTSNDEALWQQYEVSQSADDFIITPLKNNGQINSLTVSFSNKGVSNKVAAEQLSEFSFVDATGQRSTIMLADFDATTKPEKSLFDFNLPQGVDVVDKR